MATIKRLLGLVRKYHVWDNCTGIGEVYWLTPDRARKIASCGYDVQEVR